MKKAIFFLSLSALSLTSCGGEDETPYDSNAIQSTRLVTRTVETDDDGVIYTSEFHYDGYKITNFTDSDDGSGVFTYDGNHITQAKYYDGSTLMQTDIFTFNAQGKVATHQMLLHEEDYGEREVYTHNPDGTVTFTSYSGTLDEQNNADFTGKLFFENGEVIKKETYTGAGLLSSETYVYDDRNNPFKNVTGLNEMFIYEDGEITGVNRNLLSTSGTTNPVSITYEYDELSRFPTKSTSTSALEGGLETLYFYE